jgi:hypothetical protein
VKIRSLMVVAAVLVTSGAAVLSSPASAGEGEETATLTVIKTVEGTAPADAEFVINVLCVNEEINGTIPIEEDELTPVGNGVVYDEDITFGPEGGEEEFLFFREAVCTITETDDGGADEVINRELEVAITDPELFEAEITNVFADVVTTTTTAAPTTTAAAAAAAATPRFTG